MVGLRPHAQLRRTNACTNRRPLTQLPPSNRVVLSGEPPYSSGQDSANDNNANEKYAALDAAIRDTYAARSTATLKNSLYDSYIRAIKWATLRIKDRGVIAFVTNGGWLDSNTADGMRLTLAEEFSDIHVYNLRGNQRTAGEQSRKEGDKVFDAGSRATVAITVLVRDPTRRGTATIHYTDIGDYLSRDAKLAKVAAAGAVTGLEPVTHLTPNDHGDWLNQRRDDFGALFPIEADDSAGVFAAGGAGLKTNRDAWVFNFSGNQVADAIRTATNSYVDALMGNRTDDPSRIKWSSGLEGRLDRGEDLSVGASRLGIATYRPFQRVDACLDRRWIDRPGSLDVVFPDNMPNIGLVLPLPGSMAPPFLLLAFSGPVDAGVAGIGGVRIFPRWRYEKATADDGMLALDAAGNEEVIDGYRRIDNITDEALQRFRAAYGDAITKHDIFFYVYGLLHSPDYRETYAADLKKMLPRIPLVTDARLFIDAGRALSDLHLGYESVARYPLAGLDDPAPAGDAAYDHFRVEKIAFAKVRDPDSKNLVADRSTIVYNARVTLSGIPDEAHRYMLGARSAIEWIVDRYQIKTDKASGIVNDPNDWSREVSHPRYIIDLLARIVTVSLETMKVVDALPALDIRADQT